MVVMGALLAGDGRAQGADGEARLVEMRQIAAVELALVDLGYVVDAPDGYMDPQSAVALEDVARRFRIPSPAPVGEAFVEAMRAVIGAQAEARRQLAVARRHAETRLIAADVLRLQVSSAASAD